MKIGPTVDFRNYEEYYRIFEEDLGEKLDVIEFHIINKDVANANEFKKAMTKITDFIIKKKIVNVSFHAPDSLKNNIFLYGLSEKDKRIKSFFNLRKNDMEHEKDRMRMIFELVSELAKKTKTKPIIAIHQGGYFPGSFLKKLNEEGLIDLKLKTLQEIKKNYGWMKEETKGENILLALESSPPFVASMLPGNDYQEHFIDQVFEDFSNRLYEGDAFIMDICHVAMCIEYFRNKDAIKGRRSISLDTARKQYNGIPKSMASLANFLKMAKKNIAWFHFNDANGIYGENEGLPILNENSIVDWKGLVSFIKKEFGEPKGVIEVVGGEKDYTRIRNSLLNLKRLFA